MSQREQTDLFPWILVGVVVAIAVPAVMALSSGADAPVHSPKVTSGTASSTQATPTSVLAASMPIHSTPLVSQASAPAKIWHCESNGQKVFSDSPCGSQASVQSIGAINRMDATPSSPATAYSSNPTLPHDAVPYDQYAEEPGVASSSTQVILIGERERREHLHREHEHEHEHEHERGSARRIGVKRD